MNLLLQTITIPAIYLFIIIILKLHSALHEISLKAAVSCHTQQAYQLSHVYDNLLFSVARSHKDQKSV